MKGLYHAGLGIVLTIIYTLQVISLTDEPNSEFVLILFTVCAVLGLVLLLVKARR